MGMASSDEVIRYLRQAKAMLLPSFAEGLPVVIMEALALRVPVIVSAIAGTPELVDDQCGWLVSAGSTEDLVTAMIQALEAPRDQISRMGNVGRHRVEENHNALENGRILNQMFLTGAADV